MALQENLENYSVIVQRVTKSMQDLKSIAILLGKNETANALEHTIKQLKSDSFNIVVLGRFNNGKSTFVNALLGKLQSESNVFNNGPIPTSLDPCTAVLTRIRYAEEPYILALHFDGTKENWSMTRYLEESTLRINKKQTEEAFSKIREFEMGYPAPILKYGLTIIDSPGLDEDDKRTTITLDSITKADAAVVFYRSDSLAGKEERSFVENYLKHSGIKIFSIINLFNNREVNERFRAIAWYRLIGDFTGQDFTGQDLEQHDIHFINALNGYQSKWSNNDQDLANSGLSRFEDILSNFLITERVNIHLYRFIMQAENIANKLLEDIYEHQNILNSDVLVVRKAIDQSYPILEKLKKRPIELERNFSYYENKLSNSLRNSFEAFSNNLRAAIPQHMQTVELPSLKNSFNLAINRSKCEEEANKVCNEYIKLKVSEWGENDAAQLIQTYMEQLSTEMEKIIENIGKDFSTIKLTFENALQIHSSKNIINSSDSVSAGLIGTILLDPSSSFFGFTFGWRGLAVSLGSRLATAFSLVFLGFTGPVAIIVTLVLGSVVPWIWGSDFFEKRLRTSVADGYIKGLQNKMPEMLKEMEISVKKEFLEMRSPILEKIHRNIKQQIEQIQQFEADNERAHYERQEKVKQFENCKIQIKDLLSVMMTNV